MEWRIKPLRIALSICLLHSAAVRAADQETVDRLNAAERTWHREMVFRIPYPLTMRDQMITALDWFNSRVLPPNDKYDARYSLVYSHLLWMAKANNTSGTALAFAIVGYLKLMSEAARCDDYKEAVAYAYSLAPLWGGQMSELLKMPLQDRLPIVDMAYKYLSLVRESASSDPRMGSTWLCYRLPSYERRIKSLPKTVEEVIEFNGKTVRVYFNSDEQPKFAAADEYVNRRDLMLEFNRIAYHTGQSKNIVSRPGPAPDSVPTQSLKGER